MINAIPLSDRRKSIIDRIVKNTLKPRGQKLLFNINYPLMTAVVSPPRDQVITCDEFDSVKSMVLMIAADLSALCKERTSASSNIVFSELSI